MLVVSCLVLVVARQNALSQALLDWMELHEPLLDNQVLLHALRCRLAVQKLLDQTSAVVDLVAFIVLLHIQMWLARERVWR